MVEDGVDQSRAVADGVDDLVAGLGEEQLEPLAEQDRVVGDLTSLTACRSGTSARSRVGPPSGEATIRSPSTPASRSRSPSRPRPGATWAPPRPSSSTVTTSIPSSARSATWARDAWLCFAMLVSASATVK